MAKTIYFYRMNIFDDSGNQTQRLSRTEAHELVDSYISSLKAQRSDNIAISKFSSRLNDRDIYFEVIDTPEFAPGNLANTNYIFGMIGQKAGTNYHLREEDTSSSRDLPLQTNQSLEAATFFLLDKRTMVCCFAKEKSGPMIEELNNLFVGNINFGTNRILMAAISNPSALETIIGKNIIANVGFEIEVPNDDFFEILDVDFAESEFLVDKGHTVLKVELRSDSSRKSLLEGMEVNQKRRFLSKIVEGFGQKSSAEKLKKPNVYSTGRNEGELKQEYSFLDDEINFTSKIDFSASKLQTFADSNRQLEGRMVFFMFTKQKLLEKMIQATRSGNIS